MLATVCFLIRGNAELHEKTGNKNIPARTQKAPCANKADCVAQGDAGLSFVHVKTVDSGKVMVVEAEDARMQSKEAQKGWSNTDVRDGDVALKSPNPFFPPSQEDPASSTQTNADVLVRKTRKEKTLVMEEIEDSGSDTVDEEIEQGMMVETEESGSDTEKAVNEDIKQTLEATYSPTKHQCPDGYELKNGAVSNYGNCPGTRCPGYCCLPKNKALTFCSHTPACAGISETSNLGWLRAYPQQVTPGKAPITAINEWKTCAKIAGGKATCNIGQIDATAYKISEGFSAEYKPKDVQAYKDWSLGLSIASSLAGGASGLAGSPKPTTMRRQNAGIIETNAVSVDFVNKTNNGGAVAPVVVGTVVLGTVFSVASSSLSHYADKEGTGDPYGAVDKLAELVNRNSAALINDINQRQRGLVACINAVETRLRKLVAAEIKNLNVQRQKERWALIKRKTDEVKGEWATGRTVMFKKMTIMRKKEKSDRMIGPLEELIWGKHCYERIEGLKNEMPSWDVENDKISQAKAQAHFDQLPQAKDLLNLCYTAALSSYILFRIDPEGTGSLNVILDEAKLMLDTWVRYFKSLSGLMFRMSGCPDTEAHAQQLMWQMQNRDCAEVLQVVDHEKILAMDKQNTIKYLEMFATGDQHKQNWWYPARANTWDRNCKGWNNNKELCRKCSRKNHKMECGEFKTSMYRCIKDGFVWLPRGDTENCNWEAVDQRHHNPWANLRRHMRYRR